MFSFLPLSVCLSVSPLTVEGRRVAAAFEGAAAELQGSEVKMARVNVAEEKDLAKKLDAASHPIRLYLSGDIHNPVPCPGKFNFTS